MKMPQIIIVSLAFGLSLHAFQQDIAYGGDGCPEGTAQISYQENGSIVLSLDSYESHLQSGHVDRKSCNIAMPISVPEGYVMKPGKITLVGSYDLKSGTRGNLDADIFFAGSRGNNVSKTINGNDVGEIYLEVRPDYLLSACGKDVILRLNSSAVISSQKDINQTSILKINNIIIDKYQLRRCANINDTAQP